MSILVIYAILMTVLALLGAYRSAMFDRENEQLRLKLYDYEKSDEIRRKPIIGATRVW